MPTTAPPTRINDVDIARVGQLVEAVSQDPGAAATTWRADVRWTGGFRSESTIRDFAPIPSDEPAGLGGTDLAPNPVEQLLAALGNCLAVGYAANATVLGIEIDDLAIALEGELDLHTFLGLKPDGNAGFKAIKVSVSIESSATDEQVEQLHEQVVATSPVGHTLKRPVPVKIELA